jgi:hypothetical protein
MKKTAILLTLSILLPLVVSGVSAQPQESGEVEGNLKLAALAEGEPPWTNLD